MKSKVAARMLRGLLRRFGAGRIRKQAQEQNASVEGASRHVAAPQRASDAGDRRHVRGEQIIDQGVVSMRIVDDKPVLKAEGLAQYPAVRVQPPEQPAQASAQTSTRERPRTGAPAISVWGRFKRWAMRMMGR